MLLVVSAGWAPLLGAVAAPAEPHPAARVAVPQARDTLYGAVRGVAVDRLAGRALSGATISVAGAGVATTADDAGRFVLEAVPPGERRLTLTHPDLSPWLEPLADRSVRVVAGETVSAELEVPDAGTLLDRFCPAGARALVGGGVFDLLTLVALPESEVTMSAGAGRLLRAGADEGGVYHLCVEDGGEVSLEARLGQARSRPARVELAAGRVVARDLYVRATLPARIEGRVRDESSAEPVRDVVIRVEGARTGTITDDDGRFVMTGVPPGELTLVAEHVAYGEARGSVLVAAGDTLEVEFALSPAPIEVDALDVVVRARASEARVRAATRFDALTRAEIDALLPRTTTFTDLLENANIPGLHVQRVEYERESGIRTPGVCVEVSRRRSMYERLCLGMVAVYVNDVLVARPEEYLLDLDPGAVERLQLVSPLEAIGRYGGMQARNGVLLIYTR